MVSMDCPLDVRGGSKQYEPGTPWIDGGSQSNASSKICVTEEFDEKRRHTCFQGQPFSAGRVGEGNRSSVKSKSRAATVFFAILPVAYYRMADIGEMDADLMLPTRERLDIEQRHAFGLFEHTIGRTA